MDKKYIIREIPAEHAELSFYFDDDGLTEAGGDYSCNLFIVNGDWRGRPDGFNMDEYRRIMEKADGIIEGFYDVEHKAFSWTSYETYKDVMKDWGIDYTSHKCHLFKEWAKNADTCHAESIAAFLTITTGKPWGCKGVHGYCQGDYCDVVYCEEHYNKPEIYGEVYLGCAKEFCVIDLDENGEEGDSCCGYIVADCEAWQDADYKRLVCEWAGIKPEETRLEMIDGYHTYTKYEYRTA